MNSTTDVKEPIELDRTVGAVIQRAREEQSKTKAQALQVLNLRRDQLDALESNNFQKLPGDAFVRGYIRAYARWLQIDSDELLAVYLQQSGKDSSSVPSSELKPRSSGNKSDNGRFISAALLVFVLISGFWVYSSRNDTVVEPEIEDSVIAVDTFSGESLSDEKTEGDSEDEGESEELSDTTSAQNWENPFGAQDTDGSEVVGAAAEKLASTNNGADSDSASAAATNVTQPATVQQAEVVSSPVDAGGSFRGIGPDRLVFSFKEDCWLEVKNANNTVIYSAVRKAGRTLRLRGTAPFRVKVGNAPAISGLLFNDAPIEVKATNRRNMARLTLGG